VYTFIKLIFINKKNIYFFYVLPSDYLYFYKIRINTRFIILGISLNFQHDSLKAMILKDF